MGREEDVDRIRRALDEALETVRRVAAGSVEVRRKEERNDPVTAVDLAVDATLRKLLPREGEGWLSEETADDRRRLSCSRVWIVDPLDGTREFIEKVPEWCVSIGLVEDGRPVAGGIANPATGDRVLGSLETGVFLNGRPVRVTGRASLEGASVLASRSELRKGQWERFGGGSFRTVPMGSVALKLALVAAGLHDATWSLAPKHEWDVAGGVALVLAAGGDARTPDGAVPSFNREHLLLEGLVASTPALAGASLRLAFPGSSGAPGGVN
jgi:myo-inositol-1(or 4)-monophosphatase